MKFKGYDDEKLYFDDGSYIATSHEQDCCERNYADWYSLNDTGFHNKDFKEIKLERWEGGFRINGYAVNCYSEQNGYYSNVLTATYYDKNGNAISEIDTECKMDLNYL